MNASAKLFLVEDDVNFGAVLKAYLQMNDFVVTLMSDGASAKEQYRSGQYDLCILDVMLPGLDGFTLAKHIRMVDPDVPFIFLTAKTLKEDVVLGYGLGADDYITKPFDSELLLLKIQAILRRLGTTQNSDRNIVPEISLGRFTIITNSRTLKINDFTFRLSPKEFELLLLLNQHRNMLLEREEALRQIWGDFSYFTARSMDVYIAHLRRHLAEDPSITIENIH